MFNYIFSFNFFFILLFIFKNKYLFLRTNKYFYKNNYSGYFRFYRSRILYRVGLHSFYN